MTMASSPAALILAVLFAVGGVTIKETFPNEQTAQQAAAQTPAEFAPLRTSRRPISRSGGPRSPRSTSPYRTTASKC